MTLIQIISFWFKEQKPMTKLFITITLILFVSGAVLGVKYALLKHRYIKEKEKEIVELKDSLEIVNAKVHDLSFKGQEINQKAKKKANNIHQKLKQDEKNIHDHIVTDDELAGFLSKYEQKARQHNIK